MAAGCHISKCNSHLICYDGKLPFQRNLMAAEVLRTGFLEWCNAVNLFNEFSVRLVPVCAGPRRMTTAKLLTAQCPLPVQVSEGALCLRKLTTSLQGRLRVQM